MAEDESSLGKSITAHCLRHSIVFCAPRDDDARLLDTFGGVVLSIDARWFMFTAAHVEINQPALPWRAIVADDAGNAVPLNIRFGEGAADKKRDAAVVELLPNSEEASQQLASIAVPLERAALVDPDDPGAFGDFVTLAGFPSAASSTIGGDLLGFVCLTVAVAGARGRPNARADGLHTIALIIESDDVAENTGTELVRLSGLSGSAYWAAHTSATHPLLIGVHRSSATEDSWLEGGRYRVARGVALTPFFGLVELLAPELSGYVAARVMTLSSAVEECRKVGRRPLTTFVICHEGLR